MEDEFVDFEGASSLKKLGFDEECFAYYENQDKYLVIYYNNSIPQSEVKRPKLYKSSNQNSLLPQWATSAPTWQSAFKWLERKYGMFLDRKTICSVNEVMGMDYYVHSIYGTWQVDFPGDYSEFDEVKAKTKCLEKLIEIVTKKA